MALSEASILRRENELLRERLSKLSEACLRINESLDFDTVLQVVLENACSLTDARYGLITLLDDAGRIQDLVTTGLTEEEHRRLLELPEGMQFFEYLEYLSRTEEPLRLNDFHSHIRALGLPELHPPIVFSSPLTFLAAPIRHRGEDVGAIYVGEKEQEFTLEDEETLVLFASQAALVIANARRYREERRVRADLETLINTSPMGVVVLDAKTGAVTSINREAARIVSGLHEPDRKAEELLNVLSYRRADGWKFAPFDLVKELIAGDTVRAEEIVIEAPDGQSVTTLVNGTAIRSEEGEVESVVVTIQDMTQLEELERMRAEFLATVSHELRTPLTSIRGSATTLLDETVAMHPTEMREFYRIILDQSDRMGVLISKLLDMERIETGSLPVDPRPVKVADLVDEARNTFLNGRVTRRDPHRPR